MSARFATTQWTQVLAAREGDDAAARNALAVLCDAYWYPIYAYVRRRGYDAEEAADLTQGFFAELLEKDLLASVDRTKGSFRAFLIASLRHFLSHQRERSGAIKRGGRALTVSLDSERAEERYRREPIETTTPETIFERRWALTLMERAMMRLEAESGDGRSDARFATLKPYLTGARPSAPYQQAADRLGTTEGAIKTQVYRLRQRYGQLLREEVEATVAESSEVDGELRHLLSAIHT